LKHGLTGNLDYPSTVGIILPTYCEAQNIERLICEIENLHLDTLILVVDDSSPDQTSDIVESLQNKYENILLLSRTLKGGLGTAITEGFRIFLNLNQPPKFLITMDADYSHNPKDIPRLFEEASNHQGLVIGSRYCKGGRIAGWPLTRRIVSRIANIFANSLLGLRIHDCTSGFRCYSREYLDNIISNLHCTTYEIQIETLKLARIRQFEVKEMPVLFINRKRGKSKLSVSEIRGYVSYVLRALSS
jgi:dolichol-phosphate mannosyltransferase